MTLTPHQQKKFQEEIKLLKSGITRSVILGSAGVGKTVLASELVNYLRTSSDINGSYNNGIIYVTAPTNKALAVLMGKINLNHDEDEYDEGNNLSKVAFKTIHSALKLKRDINSKTGKVTFIPTGGRDRPEDLRYCKACIIDEASMLNKDIEDKYLVPYNNFPIIYIGDEKQLNPVGEPFSLVFHKDYKSVELTEIIRQKEGNPIIELSRNLDRIYSREPRVISIVESLDVISSLRGYLYSDNKDSVIHNLALANGTDDLKYLAYTNAEVNKINYLVRIKRYGRPNKIEQDETIVFNAPYGRTFYTNIEAKIDDLEIITDKFIMPTAESRLTWDGNVIGKYDEIKVRYYRCTDLRYGSFNVVHEDDETAFKLATSVVRAGCNRQGWDWKLYYYFVEQFADIKYNHAITVHKAQGSTYKEAIINIRDIGYCKDANERVKLLYTAVTRPSDLIIFNNVKQSSLKTIKI